ncbi:hypothetical protein LCGC14_1411000 [marine sediment metagenome]|uniref:Uncharacterized protein n=1 Tax=marine sediment metagenome TaxID=412755 RepID=A0A0F9KFC4_9ZZZZ
MSEPTPIAALRRGAKDYHRTYHDASTTFNECPLFACAAAREALGQVEAAVAALDDVMGGCVTGSHRGSKYAQECLAHADARAALAPFQETP